MKRRRKEPGIEEGGKNQRDEGMTERGGTDQGFEGRERGADG